MSDEQLRALGLPRREFLKKAALGAGVFVAPVVVSFGFGGTAEASNDCFPNQSVANQQAASIGSAAILVWTRERQNLVDPEFASQLRRKLFDAEASLLDGKGRGCCRRLVEVVRAVERKTGDKIDPSAAAHLVSVVENIYNVMGCDSCV